MIVLPPSVSSSDGGFRTKELLLNAVDKAKSLRVSLSPTLVSDSGTEDVNQHVKEISNNFSDHLLAQIDIDFSNSMIEAFFRRLKNAHLYFQELLTISDVKKHCDFYIQQLNEAIPLNALGGATPLEMITNSWSKEYFEKVKSVYKSASEHRLKENRSNVCELCLA